MEEDKDLQIKELEELNNVLKKNVRELETIISVLRSSLEEADSTILDLKDRMYDGID